MDTSETYIKMCEKATEIRELRKGCRNYEDGDICYLPHSDISMDRLYYQGVSIIWNELIPNAGYHDYDSYWSEVPKEAIWLPRQDQLQEMLEMARVKMLEDLLQFLKESWIVTTNWQPFTFEQLWIGFVMREKYNKVWDGEDWVEQK